MNELNSETSSSRTAYESAIEWLMGRINYERTHAIPYQERQLKLDRMRQLLTRLGQPDAGLKIVHIAGTKGKGSTAAMIAAILSAAGYRTGMFTSPHLDGLEERFSIDAAPCTAAELVALIDRLRPVVRTLDVEALTDCEPAGGPTYFELTTAMALLHFVERQADVAVLEVGLGGRLDSTNVCLPVVSVITTISFDHMKQLGNTLTAIAREKAGIIKPGVPVVSGVTTPEAQAVIAEVALDHGCRLIQMGRDFRYTYHPPVKSKRPNSETVNPVTATRGSLDFQYELSGQEHRLESIELAMHGPHQAANAAVALAVVAELRHQGWCISTEAARLGISRAVLPGRVELLGSDPLIVVDTAHNAASAQALIVALAELPKPSRTTAVLSISRDKDIRAILNELAPHFDRYIVTQYQENPRAVPARVLAEMLVESLTGRPAQVISCATPEAAWQHALQTAVAGELVCIAGSFFLAAEMRRLIRGKRLQ